MSPRTTRRPAGAGYLSLIERFPLRPVRSEADLAEAVAVIDSLIDRGRLSRDERDYLDVLTRLVETYEDEHDPLPDLSGAEALRTLMVGNALTQAQLARETGIPMTTISEVLNGKRGFSPRSRAAFARRFRVAESLFV